MILCVFIIITMAAVSDVSNPNKEVAQTMLVVAKAWQANQNHLQTWTGDVDLSHSLSDQGGAIVDNKGKIDFAYDSMTRNYYSKWNRGEAKDQATFRYAEMRKDGKFFTYSDLSGSRVLTIDVEKQSNFNRHDRRFVPQELFSPNGLDVYGLFTKLSTQPDVEQFSSVEKIGEIVTVTIEDDDVLNIYEFDVGKGNLISYRGISKDKSADEKWTWEYTNISGVWVPTKIIHSVTAAGSSGPVKIDRVTTIVKQTVNQPLPPDAFAIDHLGVKAGDFVKDHILNFVYEYSGEDAIAKVTDMPEDPSYFVADAEMPVDIEANSDLSEPSPSVRSNERTANSNGEYRYAVAGAVSVLVVMLIIFALRFYRSRSGWPKNPKI